MSRVSMFLASLAACAALAAPAAAQPGKLYEPFPGPASDKQVKDFVRGLPGGGDRLADELSTDELEKGRLVAPGSSSAGPRDPASARADADSGFAPSTGWGLAVGLLVLAFGSARVVAGRQA
jgi:hypothetical protein